MLVRPYRMLIHCPKRKDMLITFTWYYDPFVYWPFRKRRRVVGVHKSQATGHASRATTPVSWLISEHRSSGLSATSSQSFLLFLLSLYSKFSSSTQTLGWALTLGWLEVVGDTGEELGTALGWITQAPQVKGHPSNANLWSSGFTTSSSLHLFSGSFSTSVQSFWSPFLT